MIALLLESHFLSPNYQLSVLIYIYPCLDYLYETSYFITDPFILCVLDVIDPHLVDL